MQFAHTLGEGGPEIEFLIVAAAMLVLGIVFFMQKAVKPVVSVVLVVGAIAMGVGAFAVGGSSDSTASGGCGSLGANGDTSLTIVTPSDGDVVAADEPIALDIKLEGASGDKEGGHFDVRVDEQLETMTAQTDPEVTFSAGEHELNIEYVTSQHQSFDPPVFAIVCVTAE